MTEPTASRRIRAPRTLRRRLVVTVVGVVTLVSLAIGVVSLLVLRGYLLTQLDQELEESASRTLLMVAGPPSDSADPGGPSGRAPAGLPMQRRAIEAPGGGVGTVIAVDDGERMRASYLDDNFTARVVTGRPLAALERAADSGEHATIDLGGDLGRYRVASVSEDRVGVVVGTPTREIDATLTWVGASIGAVSLAGGVLLAGFVTVYIRRSLRPLENVADTAVRVSALPLDTGDVALSERVAETDADPRTEVGKVGFALNRMLGHIERSLAARQASEAKMRRFVADASHELRTPLSAIRGYSELTRRMASGLPNDAAYALGRIESESQRMSSLVEDLLLLARLDEGRTLERLPVDLSALCADAVNDARIAGSDHEWVLDLDEGPVEVVGDAYRLQQVIVNLLSNARVHTPPGTRVTVGLRAEADRGPAVLTVTDDGPGMPPEQRETVFERFARADTSRTRRTGSTGLGLPIVRGVVRAHGGMATVASEPGATVVTVRLPRDGAVPAD